MKSQEYELEYASARATPALVGRKEILGMIEQAIEEKGNKTQVIYITAKGGMGKTRLLEDVVKRWISKSNATSKGKSRILVVNRLIDLYHTHTHSNEGLIAEIVDALDPDGLLFSTYINERSEQTRMRFEGKEIQENPMQNMRYAFIADLNELGGKYDKIILAFDTAEVLTYEPDRIQESLGLTEQPFGVARWLTQDFLRNLQNAVVLIAGRPEPNSAQLASDLEKSGANVIKYDLPSFNESETLEYFQVVMKVTSDENPQSAKRIASIPEETQRKIHFLTRGEPFVLALLIDYLAIAKTVPSLEERDTTTFRDELRDLIVEAIQDGWRPLDQVVDALSWAPKGMGAELLAWVLFDQRPTDEQIARAREYIMTLQQPDKRLSFVKIRATDDSVFLQDEMYALMDQVHTMPAAALQRRRIFKNILEYYEVKIRQTHREIEEMEKETRIVGEITAEKLIESGAKSSVLNAEKMRLTLAYLQALQVEQVYYTLQADASKGFELYLKYADESFQGRDLNLYVLLRDELLRFTRKTLPVGELTLDDIEAEIGSRWIKLILENEPFSKAKEKIRRFREAFQNLLKPGSYADLNLKFLEARTLVIIGKHLKRAKRLLNEIVENVEKLPVASSLDQWRIDVLRAYAISMLGYLHRTLGEFRLAVEKYLEAVPLWRGLNFTLAASNNLNNLAWAEAECGDFQTALVHCKDGLRMRRRLGKPYLIGLSLNTLGLIEMREGSPERARFHCEQALEIFREMEAVRGIGLASHALAEALRRMTNADLLTRGQAIQHLQDAYKYADDAITIFRDQIQEPLRLVEAYIELGCVYRGWVRYLSADDPARQEQIEKSCAAYEAAVQVAEDTGYEYRAIDALVNMAWLFYYVGDIQQVELILRTRVRDERMADSYLYTREHTADEKRIPNAWNWVQLGKANILLGMLHFDQYMQANREDDKILAKEKLRQAAHNWTLSMAYNSFYGKNFRDFNKGREDVYERLDQLNLEELSWVVESMNQTHEVYSVAQEQRAFEQLLKERFGL